MPQHRVRVVLAKLGLDGHDRGVRVVARALRDAGMEVIYAGLWQSPRHVARTAVEEDADVVGVSLLSGAHMTLMPQLLEAMRVEGCGDVPVILGGTIPECDRGELMRMGVAAVFESGTPTIAIVERVRALAAHRADHAADARST